MSLSRKVKKWISNRDSKGNLKKERLKKVI
jgi:hypothetical protein